MIRSVRLPLLTILCGFACSAFAADEGHDGHRYVGLDSCATSGCHGGGTGKNQVQLHRKDQHANAHTAMAQASWSAQLTQNLGIANPYTSARCTVCHSPMQTVSADKFVSGMSALKAGAGVSCESCHGPAEYWLRTHTRPDYDHAMRVAIGIREMKDLYSRANACVGCHQNIDPDIVANGHVPLTFELDDYDTRETAHWKDEGAWLGPRRWLIGQAVALREVSWMLATSKPGPGAAAGVKDMQDRWQALSWLLRKTDAGKNLPGGNDYTAMEGGSDRLARAAAAETWSKASTTSLLRTLIGTSREFGKTNAENSSIAAKRGYLLAVAIRRLYLSLKSEGGLQSPNIEKAIDALFQFAKGETAFDGDAYSAMLLQIEVELAKL
jgi:hypothetical protein